MREIQSPFPMFISMRWRNLLGEDIFFTLIFLGMTENSPRVGGSVPPMFSLSFLAAVMTSK